MAQFAVLEPLYEEPKTTAHLWVFSDPRKCNACGRRRQTLECVCCQEHYCRECLWKTEPAHDKAEPACNDCVDEARDYAQWGMFGPP